MPDPGWYTDPTPPPGFAPHLRWWDGTRWTEHVAPMPAQQPPQQPPQQPVQHPGPYAGQYGAQYPASYAPTSPGAGAVAKTTPDGVPLAGWWHRVGATLVDGLILIPVYLLISLPFLPSLIHRVKDYIDQLDEANRRGLPPPSQLHLQVELWPYIAGIGAIAFVVQMVYNVGFLRWKQGTPGKLLTGLRVRRRDVPGPLPWKTIWLHWLGQSGVGILGLVPLVGNVAGLYSLLDDLWPLWDDKNQAIHDKIAGTNVVRMR